MNLRNPLYIFLMVGLLMTACSRENSFEEGNEVIEEKPAELVNIALLGYVTDKNGKGIVNAKVSIGNNFVFSDQTGLYFFPDVLVAVNGSIVKVEIIGYKTMVRIVKPNSLKVSQEDFVLEDIDSKLVAKVGSSIPLKNIEIELVYSDSALLDNQLAIRSSNLELSAYHHSQKVQPISLGISSIATGTDQDVRINTMFSLNHYNEKGIEVSINERHPVVLKYLGTQLLNPILFKLDELKGIWKIQRNANNNMAISDDGMYALGVFDTKTQVTGKLVDQNGVSLPQKQVTFIDSEKKIIGTAKTDQSGLFSARVPSVAKFDLQVVDGCNISSTIFSGEANGLNANIGNLTTTNTKRLTINLRKCSGEALENGLPYEFTFTQGKTINKYLSSTGSFQRSVDLCSGEVKLNVKQRGQSVADFNIPIEVYTSPEVVLNNFEVCPTELSGQITVDSTRYLYASDNFIIISNGDKTNDIAISNFTDFAVAINNVTKAGEYKVDKFTFFKGGFFECPGTCELIANVRKYGTYGQMMDITLDGKIGTRKISAVFKNIRQK